MERVSISYAADSCVMGSWKNVSIVVWGTTATVPLVAELVKLSDGLVALHPKLSTIQMIVDGAAIPDGPSRAALDKLIERYYDYMVCAATLVEGSGFWASAMRGFITSLQLVQRHRAPVKFKTCATVPELAKWFPEQHAVTGVSVDPDELTRTLTELLQHPVLQRTPR